MNEFFFQRDRFREIEIADFQQVEMFEIFDHFLLRLVRLDKIFNVDVLAEHGAAFLEIGRKPDRLDHLNRIQIADRFRHEHLEAAFAHADILVFILIENLRIDDFQLVIDDVQIIAD